MGASPRQYISDRNKQASAELGSQNTDKKTNLKNYRNHSKSQRESDMSIQIQNHRHIHINHHHHHHHHHHHPRRRHLHGQPERQAQIVSVKGCKALGTSPRRQRMTLPSGAAHPDQGALVLLFSEMLCKVQDGINIIQPRWNIELFFVNIAQTWGCSSS